MTALAYNINARPDKRNVNCLATCSEDKTVFLFDVLGEDNYTPVCFVPLQRVPRYIDWSPDPQSSDQLLITCDAGFVVEMIAPCVVGK